MSGHVRSGIHVSRDLGHMAFNLGVPEQPPAFSGYDVALVRDGRIAVLHTLVNAGFDPEDITHQASGHEAEQCPCNFEAACYAAGIRFLAGTLRSGDS